MKLALFADLHSNLEAITACLAHAQSLGVDRYAFLGDLVGYGANPVAVLDLIEHHVVEGAVVVLGNHDGAVLGRPDDTLSSQARTAIAAGPVHSWAKSSTRFSPGCRSRSGTGTPTSSSCMPVPPRPSSGATRRGA